MLGLVTAPCCHTLNGINQTVSFMGRPLVQKDPPLCLKSRHLEICSSEQDSVLEGFEPEMI